MIRSISAGIIVELYTMELAYLAILFVIALLVLLSSPSVALSAFVFGCVYSPVGVGFTFLGLNFPFFRLLVILAVLRIIARGEHRSLVFLKLDHIVVLLSGFLLLTSLFHPFEPGSGPIYVSGILLNSTGAYFVFRALASTPASFERMLNLLPFFLVPVALLMVVEQVTQINYFSLISSLSTEAMVRNDRIRSQGPFSHPILAGAIGAAFIPFVFLSFRNRIRSVLLAGSCLTIIATSASSGPVVALLTVCVFLLLWRYRHLFRYLHLVALACYLALMVVMNRPPYYLIGEIDFASGSTGWYRAYLIESTIRHFSEWWLIGTDRTIHWIPFQLGISEAHADITNAFIGYAVVGGLSALCIFIWLNWEIYRISSRVFATPGTLDPQGERLLFLLWASFTGTLATFFSVAYFGQAQVFYWMVVALIANTCNEGSSARVRHTSVSDEHVAYRPGRLRS